MNEKENTIRALQEKPLLVTSMWCRVSWHHWTQWTKGQWVKNRYGQSQWIQTRRCSNCNTQRARTVKGIV